jgi:hypothetical protein
MNNYNEQNTQNDEDSKTSHQQSERKIAQNGCRRLFRTLDDHADSADLSDAAGADLLFTKYRFSQRENDIIRADAE